MEIFALLIAIIALVVAIVAYVRAGDVQAVKRQAEQARVKTADALGQVEELVRPSEGSTAESGAKTAKGIEGE